MNDDKRPDVTNATAEAADAAPGTERARRFGSYFYRNYRDSDSMRLLYEAGARWSRRPIAGFGLRVLAKTEAWVMRELRNRLDRAAGAPADPLGTTSASNQSVKPREVLQALLRASRGTNQAAIEHDFYVRVLRQLNPSQARILVLMSSGLAWPMVHVDAGGLLGTSHERILSYASNVGKEAGVLLREQVPHFIAHMYSIGLIATGPEDAEQEAAYEILEADTLVRQAMVHIEQDRGQYAHVERCVIRLSEFGLALCEAALPNASAT